MDKQGGGEMSEAKFKTPDGLYYSKDNMWVKIEDGKARVGLTDYGQYLAKKIVYVELPMEGDELSKGDPLSLIESGKWSGELKCPISGKVVEVNTKLEDNPGLLNTDPYGEGWIAVLEPSNLDQEVKELMNPEEYSGFATEDAKKRGV